MKYLRLIFLMLALATGYVQVSAQNLGISLQHFTDENGLPQNTITHLALDNAGFLWFSTNAGLVRFDGNQFKIFGKKDMGFNAAEMLHFVCDKANKKIYVVSREKELGLISNGKFHSMHLTLSTNEYRLGSAALKKLYGHVIPYGYRNTHYSYVIPAGENLYYLNGDTLIMYRHDKKMYSNILPDNEVEPWRFFVVGGKLYHLDAHGNITHYGEKIENITLLGDLPKNKKYRKGGYETRTVVNFATGDVFIYLEDALYIMQNDAKGNLTSKYLLEGFDFSDNSVSTIGYDRQNDRVLVGSYTDGLFVLKTKQFSVFFADENLAGASGNSYSALLPLAGNKIITSKGIIFDGEGKSTLNAHFANYSDGNSLSINAAGEIFSKSFYEVFQWDREGKKIRYTWRMKRIVSVIKTDANKGLYIGTKSPGGLYFIDLENSEAEPKPCVQNLPDVVCIYPSSSAVWIGTNSGLFIWNIHNKILTEYPEFKNKKIRNISGLDADSRAIIVEDEGIYVEKNNSIMHLPADNHNFISDTRCILADSVGNLWISTGKGLFRVSRKEYDGYTSKKSAYIFYSYYGKSNGFNTNEFSGNCQPCAAVMPNGYMAFPSLNGVVVFHPETIKAEVPDKKIYIDKIIVDEKNITNETNDYKLQNNFKQVEVYYSTPYFGSPYNINFETKLDDEEWQSSTANPIVYATLPAGEHQLSIRKMNGDEKNTFSVETVTFHVPRPFWLTWWFIVICVLLVAGSVFTYTRLRVIYTERRNELLEESITERTQELKQTINALKDSHGIIERDAEMQKRLTASIAHDVKTPLKYLLLTAGSLAKTPAEELGNEQEAIKIIHKSLYRIYHFTDNLLAYIKASFSDIEIHIRDTINLQHLVKEKVDIFNDVAASQNTVINNRVDEEVLFLSNHNLLAVVIHNLLDNAVKFTFDGTIDIQSKIVNHEVMITIKDTGVGVHPEQMQSIQEFFESDDSKWTPGYNKHSGLGLVIIKEIIKQLGGRIYMDSEKDMGTTVVLYIPE